MNRKGFLLLLVVEFVACMPQGEVASDGTVPVQPLSIVPPPQDAGKAPGAPLASADPSAAQPAPGSGLNGITSETKHPDGSTTTITHFNGKLPFNAFPSFNPYFQFPSLPPYFFPGYNPNVNPNARPNVYPNANPNYNPNVNPNLNPNVNPNLNPNVNPNVNQNVNPNGSPNQLQANQQSQPPPKP